MIGFFVGQEEILLSFTLPFDLSYLNFESFVLIITLLFGIFLNSLKLSLFKNYGFDGYQAFIKSLFRGFWVMGVTLYLLVAFDVLQEETPIFGSHWEIYIFYFLVTYLAISFLPFSHNSLSNLIHKRNSLVNFRDSALGTSLTLIILDFIFNELSDPFWNSLLPFLFLTSIILLIIRDEEIPYLEKLYDKSLTKTKEMADKLNSSEFQVAEDVFIPKKTLDIIKKGSSNLSANKNSILIPVSISQDIVTVEALGDLSLNVKDSLGRMKKESTGKTTFMISRKEWQDLSRRMKVEKLDSLDLSKLRLGILTKDELIDDIKSSFQLYKEKFNTMGIDRIEANLQMIKGKYNMNVSESKTEFNFPGIKLIDEKDSMLFKMGSIEAIDVKRELPNEQKAKYFNIKLPFITASEIEHDSRYFAINMPFVSALETPKGMMMNIFGFDVTDGDKQAILNDLDRMLGVQAKFHDYYHFRMSNVLSVEKNPNFVLTQNKNDTDPKLLLAGSDDSFYIDEELPDSVFSEPKLIEAVSTDSSMIIDIAEEDITMLDDEMIKRENNFRICLDLKLEKLIKRIDSITKNEFIE